MYHLVTTNGSLIGRYGISPSDLEHDLKYLKENGYKTIGMSDLTAFVYKGRALPEKCVMLTFDDGNSGDYFFLYPLLKKYDAKAVLSIMGKQTDQFTADAEKYPGGKFPNLTWPQIREMLKDGRVEIQSHGYDVHKPGGSGRRGGETAQAYRERFKKDIQQLQTRCKEELGCAPDTFTYPLGIMSDGSREVLESLGFKATLSCTEGMNYITQGDPDGLFKLKRDIRPSGRTIEQVLARMVRKKR
jgi:peptidoglycan/xylan/chitin deacetylase (PgdA/CDA1 family)